MRLRVLHLDLETYSSAPLPKCGVYRYCDSPDFEILLLSYMSADTPKDIDMDTMSASFLFAVLDSKVASIEHVSMLARLHRTWYNQTRIEAEKD